MTKNMEIGTDEAIAERYIILDAMTDEDLLQEYAKQIGNAPDAGFTRLDVIETLIFKLQAEA